MKKGKIDRVTDNINIIGKDLFKKETNPDIFVGKKVTLQPQNKQGLITGTFGKGGKFKVKFDDALDLEDPNLMTNELEMQLKYTIWKKYLK